MADAKAYTDAQHIYVTGASVNASTNVITLGFQNSVQTVNIDISSIIEAAVTKAVTQAVAQAKQEIQYTIVPTSSTMVQLIIVRVLVKFLLMLQMLTMAHIQTLLNKSAYIRKGEQSCSPFLLHTFHITIIFFF